MRKPRLRSKEKEKEKEKKPRDHRGPHHIFPTSRQWDNIYPKELWPPESEKHIYWHELFINLTAKEAIWAIKKYSNADGVMQEEFFSTSFTVIDPFKFGPENIRFHKDRDKIPKRKMAWQIVFGDMNGKEAIEWIEREFIRKEWLGSAPK